MASENRSEDCVCACVCVCVCVRACVCVCVFNPQAVGSDSLLCVADICSSAREHWKHTRTTGADGHLTHDTEHLFKRCFVIPTSPAE